MTFPPIAQSAEKLEAEFDRITDVDDLHRQVIELVEGLLRREADQLQCRQTLAAIDHFFVPKSTADLTELRRFCKQVARLSMEKRPSRADLPLESAAPPASAERTAPMADQAIPLPFPTRHDSFAELLAAALSYRIRHVTTFFHRRNGAVRRQDLPPFLLSPDFDDQFEAVIAGHIAPVMMANPRFVGSFEHARPWKRVNTEEFWTIVAEGDGLEERLLSTWRDAWNGMKPRRDEKSGRLIAPAGLTQIRAALAPGETPTYTLPKVGNDMINLFARLLSDLRGELDAKWSVLVDLHAQEFERRWVQDRPRQGAMMDAVTALFPSLPGRLGEFVALLCHFNMQGIDTTFLREVEKASAGTVFLAAFLADQTVTGAPAKAV